MPLTCLANTIGYRLPFQFIGNHGSHLPAERNTSMLNMPTLSTRYVNRQRTHVNVPDRVHDCRFFFVDNGEHTLSQEEIDGCKGIKKG